jgi:HD-GYP domain-containing protein (c-di-GMP phosphodiesterase class II)
MMQLERAWRGKTLKGLLAQIVPQPLVSIVASALALCALGWAWVGTEFGYRTSANLGTLAFAFVLGLAVVVVGQYPIYFGYRVKIELTTVPLYLMAVLLPLPLAAAFSGLSILALELSQRSTKGNAFSDVVTAASRWVLIALAGGWVAHLSVTTEVERAVVLITAGFVMFVVDAASFSFEIWSMTRVPPWRSIKHLVREGAPIEGVQYLLGVFGALAALQQVWSLVLLALPTAIVYLAFKNVWEMREGTRRLLENMADAIDLRDPCTGGHSRRVAELTARILSELKVFGPGADQIVSAARVHDIGKIGIQDEILKKNGPLSAAEWAVMRAHPVRGAELLVRYADFSRGAEFVRHHHERWDGKGYPRGLSGLDIPFGARVISVVDALDAMTSDRPYRSAMTQEQAILVLRAGRGAQWDPSIVDAAIRVITSRERAGERTRLPSAGQEASTA